MTYEQALTWVHSLPRLASHVGVEDTRRLLAKMGNPEKSLRFVHIAGTNGKGSATVMLSAVLHTAGYKVGTTVSPYVLDFRERFMINGAMIEPEELANVLTRVKDAVERLAVEDSWDSIVEFDVVTTAALVWFSEQKCDIVCMETGLGGRLDSTNAVQNTLVACIMSIGMDHTELLGDTLDKIAGEKCGILKNKCTVICYPKQPQEAMDKITLCAKAAGCHLVVPDTADAYRYKGQAFENRINYGGYDLSIPFPGRHQAYNAMVVVEAALALCARGFKISDEAIIDGIAAARFPARIEILSRNPLVILDGGHNPDGAEALAQTLRDAHCYNLVFVLGILKEKNPEKMLATYAPLCKSIYTVTPDSPRAMPAQELADLAKRHCPCVTACGSVRQALQLAKEEATNGLVVCGSLYLASEARKLLVQN